MTNDEVAAHLYEIADLLDLLGERFKPEAYRRAARSIESLAESVETVAARNGLKEVPGVGEAIDEKVRELLRTGSIPYLDRLRREVPAGLAELMRLPGLGPKTARRFWTEFGIEGPAELAGAIDAGRLEGAKGFGAKKIAQLRAAVQRPTGPATGQRIPLDAAIPLARALVDGLRQGREAHEVAVAGSFRRCRETVGDLDILATSDEPEKVFDRFSHLPEVATVRLRGSTKETVELRGGLQVDLRVVEPEAFGAALQYFTGSKDHNVRLRSLAREKGLKINEYGVFRGEERVGGRTEEEVYRLLGLDWIPPELREDRGEIALAQEGRLPRLVEERDLRGDLHVHLPDPAGPRELDERLTEAKARSLDYVGVVVGGLDERGQRWHLPDATRRRIDQAKGRGPRLFAVVEVATPDEPLPSELGSVDGVIVRADAAAPPRHAARSTPVWLVAHLSPEAGHQAAAISLARNASAAVEVGPGPSRLDSNTARAALEQGIRLHLPLGLGEGAGRPSLGVGLGFARRAGAVEAQVVNASEREPPRRATPRRA